MVMDNKKRSKEKAEYKITEELGGLEILNAEYEKQKKIKAGKEKGDKFIYVERIAK